VGGFHTTGNLFTWLFFYLAKYQDVQKKLKQEIENASEGAIYSPTDQDEIKKKEKFIANLPFMKCVIKETLRKSALAPFAARIARNEKKDFVLNGYTISPKVPIIQALGVTLNDPKIWGNPNDFDPERFDPKNKRGSYDFTPFGFAGGRVCPGLSYTYTLVPIVVAKILHSFQIKLVEPQLEPKPVFRLVTSPGDPIYVTLQPWNK